MATNIGTGPQDIPLNQFLGEMAFMDNIISEGTFSPTIQTTTTGGQQSMVNAYYTKIGRIVVAHAQYSFPTGFSLVDLTIRNLPFTCNSAGSGAGAVFEWQDGGGFAGGMGRITAGSTTAERFGATASPSGSFVGNIWFTFTYTAEN